MDGNGYSILNAIEFYKHITHLSDSKRFWVGYSGGLDSRVLLELTTLCFQSKAHYQVNAVHVHHGLNPKADEWIHHCESVCTALEIPLTVLWVDAKARDGRSPEEVAREARFNAFKNLLQKSDCLLLGHHLEDQAETILLRLFRGTGPLGLGGIPEKSKVGEATLIRPFLSLSKELLRTFAKNSNLQWIEDDSNHDTGFDRNFLRQEIMPKLIARWPRVVRSVSRSGALCLETATAIQVLATKDLQTVQLEGEEGLSVSKLLQLDWIRRKAVIRCWLQNLGCLLPSRDHMDRINREILLAKPGGKPELKIGDYRILRKKNTLKMQKENHILVYQIT